MIHPNSLEAWQTLDATSRRQAILEEAASTMQSAASTMSFELSQFSQRMEEWMSRLEALREKPGLPQSVQEALNRGDGTYRP